MERSSIFAWWLAGKLPPNAEHRSRHAEHQRPGREGARAPPGDDRRHRRRTAADLIDPTVTIGNATVGDRFCRVLGVARLFTNSQPFANNLE